MADTKTSLEGKKAPVFTLPARDGGPPRIALYPICLSPADPRCTIVAAADAPPRLAGGTHR